MKPLATVLKSNSS